MHSLGRHGLSDADSLDAGRSLEINEHLHHLQMQVALSEPSEEDLASLREIARRPTS